MASPAAATRPGARCTRAKRERDVLGCPRTWLPQASKTDLERGRRLGGVAARSEPREHGRDRIGDQIGLLILVQVLQSIDPLSHPHEAYFERPAVARTIATSVCRDVQALARDRLRRPADGRSLRLRDDVSTGLVPADREPGVVGSVRTIWTPHSVRPSRLPDTSRPARFRRSAAAISDRRGRGHRTVPPISRGRAARRPRSPRRAHATTRPDRASDPRIPGHRSFLRRYRGRGRSGPPRRASGSRGSAPRDR
jgi:hypothetical protein